MRTTAMMIVWLSPKPSQSLDVSNNYKPNTNETTTTNFCFGSAFDIVRS